MDYLVFERRLLRLIFRTNVPLTPVHVAYHLRLPVAEARASLDLMVSSGILEIDSDDGGHIVYACPGRPPLDKLPEPKPPRKRSRRIRALDRVDRLGRLGRETAHATLLPATSTDLVYDDRRFSPAAAAALSFFLPGVGQIYSGRVPQGIGWMFATGLGYLLFLVPGLILHICCVVNAAAVPARLPSLVDRIH